MHLRAHVVFLFALLLSSIAGCGLTLDVDPPDPQGGIDAGESDAGQGTFDAGPRQDAGPDFDAGSNRDAGSDAGIDSDAGPPDLCVGRDDGDPCGDDTSVPLVCVGGRCMLSVCGDGVVDERAGETCDDGNDVAADGCEPVSCVPSCTSEEDCDDGNECNGAEACSATATCVRGTPPFNPMCTTASGLPGSCDSEICVPAECGNGIHDDGEECDDGNATRGDGCEPDCTRSCDSDTECQDGDACNGQEICSEREGCVRGSPIACVASDACHAAMCDPRDGCRVTLIDRDRDGQAATSLGACGRDCDDGDPARFEGAVERCNGLDDDCDEVVDEDVGAVDCYPDADTDGFGDESRSVEVCLCPAGSITSGGDCFDAPNPVGAAVNPAQTSFFRLPYCRDPSSTSCSFDYDCDGSEERQFEAVHRRCSLLTLLSRCTGSGWDEAVPACGVEGTWVECDGILGPLGLLCTARRTARVQTCR